MPAAAFAVVVAARGLSNSILFTVFSDIFHVIRPFMPVLLFLFLFTFIRCFFSIFLSGPSSSSVSDDEGDCEDNDESGVDADKLPGGSSERPPKT